MILTRQSESSCGKPSFGPYLCVHTAVRERAFTMREGGGCMNYEFSQNYEELAHAVIDALPELWFIRDAEIRI